MNAYVVKYASMPVIIKKDWAKCLGEKEDKEEVYYVASRCFMIGTNISFSGSGQENWTHKVVFPFLESEKFTFPAFNCEGKCKNSTEVNKLYDETELELLKKENEIKNRKLLESKMYQTNYDRDLLNELLKSYEELVRDFSIYETYLEEIQKEIMTFEKVKALQLKNN